MEVVAIKYKGIAHYYCIMGGGGGGGGVTVYKVDCLGEETVLVPGCPSNWGSVAPSDGKSSKRG